MVSYVGEVTEKVDRGAKLFAGPASDTLAQVMSGEIDPEAPTPQYVTVAQAVRANGRSGLRSPAAWRSRRR